MSRNRLASSSRFAALVLLAHGVLACTAHPAAINGPARGAGPGYVWPEDTAGAMPTHYEAGHAYGVTARAPHRPEAAPAATLQYLPTRTPAPAASGGERGTTCLRALRRAGVRFDTLDGLRGVETPVRVRGPLGGVEYWVTGGAALEMDCRLALTLSRVGSVLSRHGVTRVRFSGAYVYRTAPSGRLSHHAHGLAIDLHEFAVRGQKLSVDRAFSRNAGCARDVPVLNRLACDLRATGVFDEFLTPDYNAAHRDHLHISVQRH